MWPWTGSPAGSRSGTEAAPRGRAAGAGFTLIEVLIAFVILALALGAVLPGFSAGLRSLDTADDYAIAVLHAESRLAAVGLEEPLEEGATSGEFEDGFRWRVEVLPLDDLDPEENLPARAYGVVVTISWDAREAERSITLRTLRLGPRSPPGSRP